MRCSILLVCCLLACGSSLHAQSDSTLLDAVRLVTEGQGDSARTFVRARLASLSPIDSTYPEVLYTAGVVAATLDSATFYLRRVSIEYPRSDWADRALLRLAKQTYGAGDLSAARRAAERVINDYPFGEVRVEAAYWAGRVYLDLGEVVEGCRLLEEAYAGAAEDIELTNQIAYFRQRCASVEVPAPDDTTRPPEPAGPAVYTVQVAAVQTAQAADAMMHRVAAAGFNPHVVRDADGLFKIRIGRYTDRTQAQELVTRVRQAFGGTPFVVEEQ